MDKTLSHEGVTYIWDDIADWWIREDTLEDAPLEVGEALSAKWEEENE